MRDLRVGVGLDTHSHALGRPLYLGGVHFEGEPGLLGHSDGDVICHAVSDALLGAAALGDIGQHFPDTEAAYEGIRGLDLLARVVAMLRDRELRPASCDLTFIGDRPALAPRREEIRQNVASVLELDESRVSVKATRPEGLGLSGAGAGCLAVAAVTPSR
ncbi:MAG: 2-C-methyl-D-erythritol 2,4-cyclodiphosphate synthase [Actinomycetota bacterium]|nr:2-C-methyl-D-erythritol 2,4-cyclodiphosphate synthase [Actinomycetota bacterium]